ncbi:hypothetical protein [Tanticharoenia sakaeratensis]|jgi:hypothetical protein|uniref:FeoB-associated Cys-rich membrane protein n=1 Tax=Tanticharoenia sakaeratensis NBRC 103193 TaxID=1231623 RepID=A0A0D6MKP2_9PROT|nr:hypothetical protein [Tanticharoenia sakaeratensis]GAN53828.1 hypothetical protein Tasa_012_004 [Tanticharoenia sakaeratensis NBRC 103193]GBQ25016.1 hypothetical protein AA103193_2937 [Tanticharoenia sakaeratensis NBRC 103193]
MIEYLTVGLVVAACALYWGARLFPAQAASARTRLGFQPKVVEAPNSACGACRACKGGSGCH